MRKLQSGTNLLVSELETELLDTALDRVPARETVADGDIAGETEVLRLEDLVGGGVVEDGLGVDTSLVGEGAVTGDGVHEGNVDLDGLRDQVLDLAEHGEVVLALHVVGVRSVQARDETAERGDTDTLADTKDGSVDVGGTGLKSTVRVRDGHASVVVQVNLDVTRHDTTESTDEVVNLTRVGAANSIGDANTVDTDAVHRLVDGKEIDEVGAEGVLGRESDLNTWR